MTNTTNQYQNKQIHKSFIRYHFAFLVLIGLLGYLFIGLFPKKVLADFSLGVYPPILQIQATVPTIITKDFTIVNASQNEETVTVQLREFTSSAANNGSVAYVPLGQQTSPDSSIFSRIQILDGQDPITTLTLAPKQKKTLTLRIGLPKEEVPADYYFSILFLSNPTANTTSNGSHIAAGIAINVLLSIGPQDATSGFLNEFSTPWFENSGPIPFTVSVANTSRHFITPSGQILVRNMFGQLIGKVDLLPVNILGNSSRFIPALWPEKVLFGAYRANIVVSLSNQGPIFTRTIYFFVMPWEYIVGFFLAVVIIVIVVDRVRKRINSI